MNIEKQIFNNITGLEDGYDMSTLNEVEREIAQNTEQIIAKIKQKLNTVLNFGVVSVGSYRKEIGSQLSSDERGSRGVYSSGDIIIFDNEDQYTLKYGSTSDLSVIEIQRKVINSVLEGFQSDVELLQKRITYAVKNASMNDFYKKIINKTNKAIEASKKALDIYDEKINNTKKKIQDLIIEVSVDGPLISGINLKISKFNEKHNLSYINGPLVDESIREIGRQTPKVVTYPDIHPFYALNDLQRIKEKIEENIEVKMAEMENKEKELKEYWKSQSEDNKQRFKGNYGDSEQYHNRYMKLIKDAGGVRELISIIFNEYTAPYGRNRRVSALEEQIPSIKGMVGGNASGVASDMEEILDFFKKYFPKEYEEGKNSKYIPDRKVYSDKKEEPQISTGNSISDLMNKFNK